MHAGDLMRRGIFRRDRRGVVSIEFAVIAPVMALIIAGAFDISRAVICWQETQSAAQNIALGGASLATPVDSGSSAPSTESNLTPAQAKLALSMIYAIMPRIQALDYPQYSATLSGVGFVNNTGPGYITWSVPLLLGNAKLLTVTRACGAAAGNDAVFPGTSGNLQALPTADITIETNYTVADVHVQYQPKFFFFVGTIDFWESYVAPVLSGSATGATPQIITYDSSSTSDSYVCQNEPPS
jgi:Flp pilus assembly protein TadG